MRLFKILLLASSLIITGLTHAASSSCLEMDDEEYCVGANMNERTFKFAEFYREDESRGNWTRRVAVREYAKVKRLRAILPEYMKGIKPYLIGRPEMIEQPLSKYDEELVMISYLVPPNKAYVECEMSLFYRDDFTVRSVYFSVRMPYQEKIDVSEIQAKKGVWIETLRELNLKRYARAKAKKKSKKKKRKEEES